MARDVPPVFDSLKAAVARANAPHATRFYPGSPLIVEGMLRSRDRYIGCEFRADDHAALRARMPRRSGLEILKGDGWVIASDRAPGSPSPLLVLIDPPFERGDDAALAIRLCQTVLRRNSSATIAVWVAIKDLTSFDAFLTAFTDATFPAPVMVAELRLRPLSDPMRMNGCAMFVANPTAGLDEPSTQAAVWIAQTLGEHGAFGRVERITSGA